MSWQPPAPSATRVQRARIVNGYTSYPDFHLVAAFFLGWVFFSSLRHIWFSTFTRDLMWSLRGIFGRLRGRANGSIAPMCPQREEAAGTCPSSFHAEDLKRCEQRDALLVLPLCLGFSLASLSSFLSLLTFYPESSGTTCAFVVAASTIASHAAQVFGLVILSLHLRRRMVRPWELCFFWTVLGLGTVLVGFAVGLKPGQLVVPLITPRVALCVRKRSLPISLVSSALYFILELYTIIRVLSLMKPPRLKFSIVQDARIVQAGSLLLFDLLVLVPSAISTNVIAEFIPYSIGALSVLAAFNSLLGRRNFVPTQLDGPILASQGPGRTVVASERPINQGNLPDHVIRIDKHPFSAISLADQDVEAFASPSPSPRARQSPSNFPLDGDREETVPIASPQPVRASVWAMIASDASPSVVQLESGDHPRRGKILSYSNPVWESLGAPQDIPPVPTHPHVSIEIAGSPTSSISPSPERGDRIPRVTSHGSTILGSDIIRGTASRYGRDAMRVHQPGLASMFTSTSSIPSFSSRWAAGQSWASRLSAYPQMSEEGASVSRPMVPEETVQSLRPTTYGSSKSKKPSRSRPSSQSGKSASSIRSTMSAASKRPSSGFPATTQRSKVGYVRGPRPPPTSPRIQYEGSWGRD